MDDEEMMEQAMKMLDLGVKMTTKYILKGGFKPIAKALKVFHQDLIDAGFTELQATKIVSNYIMTGK